MRPNLMNRVGISWLLVLATAAGVVMSLSSPSLTSAAQASLFRIPPADEPEAITVGPEGAAYVAVVRYGGPHGETPEANHVYEVEPGGVFRELPAAIGGGGSIGLAGIAPAKAGSVWVPTARGVTRVGPAGIEDRVRFARQAYIQDVTGDHSGGVWIAALYQLIHVGADGSVRRFSTGIRNPPRKSSRESRTVDCAASGSPPEWATPKRSGSGAGGSCSSRATPSSNSTPVAAVRGRCPSPIAPVR
jgi:hypothetical protein